MSSQRPGCLAGLFGWGRSKQPQEQFPFRARPFFLSKAEASFYHTLKHLAGANIVIFPHVALRDLVSVTGVEKADYYRFFNQIDRKQVDFLLAESKTLKPVLVIELDDSTHQRADRVQRDRFVETVLAAARIPLARVPVQQSYDTKELAELFRRTIQMNQAQASTQKEI